jgi:cytosine/adenosine deaminase-related metal-dependent hydrolase
VRLLIEAADAALGVVDGVITPPRGRFDVKLRIPDGELRPGLINAHEHLHRNHYGRLGAPPYANAYEWGRDIHARDEARIAAGRALPRREALLRGAWKNLRAGVTTVVHHDRWELDFEEAFPLRVVPLPSAHSIGFEPEMESSLAGQLGWGPFTIHLAEGVDESSAEEVRELDRLGLLLPSLLAVHVVGADDDGVRRLRRAGAAIVWCPTSNEFLFGTGRTAPASLLAEGIDVLVGSDSLLTGAGSLLDDLRRAHEIGAVSASRLERSVGATAARRLGIAMPSLDHGLRADLVVLRRPLLEAGEDDVALVVAKGVLRVLDPTLAPALGSRLDAGHLVVSGTCARWLFDQDVGVGVSLPQRAAGFQRGAPVMSRRTRL